MQVLVLASGSQYRAELLTRLRHPFVQFSPQIDESAHPLEQPAELAQRLARQKACAASLKDFLASQLSEPPGKQFHRPDESAAPSPTPSTTPASAPSIANSGAIIIASDQVASVGTRLLGKPGTATRAREQLASMRGERVVFSTALYMLNTRSQQVFTALDQTIAHLRMLSDVEIERYVDADQPLDCAGSFKVEALGISLFESVESQDPTALIGLPMIAVCNGLREMGVAVP